MRRDFGVYDYAVNVARTSKRSAQFVWKPAQFGSARVCCAANAGNASLLKTRYQISAVSFIARA